LLSERIVQPIDQIADVIGHIPQMQPVPPPIAGIENFFQVLRRGDDRFVIGQRAMPEMANIPHFGIRIDDPLGQHRQVIFYAKISSHDYVGRVCNPSKCEEQDYYPSEFPKPIVNLKKTQTRQVYKYPSFKILRQIKGRWKVCPGRKRLLPSERDEHWLSGIKPDSNTCSRQRKMGSRTCSSATPWLFWQRQSNPRRQNDKNQAARAHHRLL
jgi:hypothetical protein